MTAWGVTLPITTPGICCCGSPTEGVAMRTIDKHRECSVPPPRSRRLAVASVLALGIGALGLARADAPDPATQAFAQRLAIGVCGTCHGPHGNSGQPKFPRLAGQSGNYLVAQVKNFRGQTRGDPDAIGYMWGMAAELDDPTIEALRNTIRASSPCGAGRVIRRSPRA